MNEKEKNVSRRGFLKASSLAATGSLLLGYSALASAFKDDFLQVWSCGGLAEAFIPANKAYEETTGCRIDYSGAFAAALGKSLLGGAKTEVFAPRVLELAQKLKAQGKMLHFVPLCFTKYVLVMPKGNPAGIKNIQDLGKPGVKTILSPNASPPGGEASTMILKKAGVLEQAQKNAVVVGDCVQSVVPDVIKRTGDVAVMELRLTKKTEFTGKMEVIEIPEEFFPPRPVTFVIGVMKFAHNKNLAEDYVKFITSERGQSFFEAAGFIPALSTEGERLVRKYGVKDA
ncbi:MAG TPA: substrate-binding domain-containing protein [Desulfomonilaceae bacterium]|nr:substrate-binding domain-containing protein [Desulfomonilaceae bacterium]